MSIDVIIAEAVARAVKDLYGVDADASAIVPQATRKEFEGNLTVVVFPWVKAASRLKPWERKSAIGWSTTSRL